MINQEKIFKLNEKKDSCISLPFVPLWKGPTGACALLP